MSGKFIVIFSRSSSSPLEHVKFIDRYNILTSSIIAHLKLYLKKESLKLHNSCHFCIPIKKEDYKLLFRHLDIFIEREGKDASQATKIMCCVR